MAFNPNYNNRGPRRKDDHGYKINNNIRAQEVRVTGENIESAVCSLQEALAIAINAGLDLVEISATANPPVVKVIDFQKFIYEKKKKEKELKQSNKSNTTKEIKLGHNIGDHDVEFKTKNSIEFLKKGHKISIYIQFRGREIAHKERGEIVMLKFIQSLEEFGKPESLPKLEGKNMYAIIAPKKH